MAHVRSPMLNAVTAMLSCTIDLSTPHTTHSIRQNRPHQVHVIDLPTACINCLQQFVHLLITHLLAQICQDVPQLSDTNKSRHVLVEHLEAAAVFFWLAWVLEAAGAVQNFGKGIKVDCAAAY